MWYVYLLRCKDNSLYTGITTDLYRRMEKHRSGNGSKYVSAHGFGKLLYATSAETQSEAAKTEHEVKQLHSHRKKQWFKKRELAYQSLDL